MSTKIPPTDPKKLECPYCEALQSTLEPRWFETPVITRSCQACEKPMFIEAVVHYHAFKKEEQQ